MSTQQQPSHQNPQQKPQPTPVNWKRIIPAIVIGGLIGYWVYDAYYPNWSFECKDATIAGIHVDPLEPEGMGPNDHPKRMHIPPATPRCTFTSNNLLREFIDRVRK